MSISAAMELWCPSLIVVVARRQPPAQLQGYMSDWQGDAWNPGKLASRSQLPQSDRYQSHNYYGTPGSSIGTSQLVCRSTRTTDSTSGSLPALSSTASSRSYSGSEASYGGGRGPTNRLLEDREGGLQIPSTPPAVPLECPFNFLSCHRVFSNLQEWYFHSLTHFESVGPPRNNDCCFCDMQFVDSNGWHSWKQRLEHIASIHHHTGNRLSTARPDFKLFEYLWSGRLISKETYQSLKGPQGGRGYPSQSGLTNQSGSVNMDLAYTISSNPRARNRHERLSRR